MRDAVVACELGPNPAPISELVQALRVQRALRVRALFLLTNRYGERYLHELHHAMEMYRAVYGDAPVLELAFAELDDGTRAERDLTPAESAAWMRARWANVQRAVAAAGADPVVFAIAANRERSVLTTAMYTLLARPGDLCLDVRVSDPRVEGAKAGFFFPTQPEPCVTADGTVIDPASVAVTLVQLELPRLRGMLGLEVPATYDAALALAQGAVDAAAPPRVVADLTGPRIAVDGVEVSLSRGQCLVWLALLLARVDGRDEGWVAGFDSTWLVEALERVRQATGSPMWSPQGAAFSKLSRDDAVMIEGVEQSVRELRSRTRRRLERFCEEQGVDPSAIVPVKRVFSGDGGRSTQQRVPLDPRFITITSVADG
jgi:hypothetical protein